MPLITNSSRETADPVDVEYLHIEAAGAPIGIHMHLDAVDGIARDVIEGLKALPRRGVEVGGLLLGKVIGADQPDVWIERYQRIDCRHRFGPQFALDAGDHAALEEAAQRIAASTELAVVGLYRSHTRPGFQLEDSDLDLIERYFSDPTDLVLLIHPEDTPEVSAQFFARGTAGRMQRLGEPFPFRGRVLGLADSMLIGDEEEDDPSEATRQTATDRTAAPAETAISGAEPVTPNSDAKQPMQPAAESPAPPRERMRRLVPDFAPAGEPVEPGGVFSFEPRRIESEPPAFTEPEQTSTLRRLAAKWWPLAGAIALVCAAMWILFGQGRRAPADNTAQSAFTEEYPVGMYVDPGPQRWRISWNPSATAFRNARSVALFVHDGEAQDRIDLTKQDVQAGVYSYQPKGNDVTFRLEVIDGSGRISAESFRVIRPATAIAPATPPQAAQAESAPAAPAPKPAAPEPQVRLVPAKATHKVPPVVPASIRPRIHGVIPIDVRVRIDAHGKVISATPVTKQKSGLNSYLASRAIYAAKLWRFTPARENGQPVPSAQTIHFVFEK